MAEDVFLELKDITKIFPGVRALEITSISTCERAKCMRFAEKTAPEKVH